VGFYNSGVNYMSIFKIAKTGILLIAMILVGAACCGKGKIPSIKYSKAVAADAATVFVMQEIAIEGMPMPLVFSGTGFGIAHEMGSTYVLTAGHICSNLSSNPVTGEEPPPHTSTFKLFDREGNEYPATVYSISDEQDLCLLETETRLRITKIAKDNPQPGDVIHYSGYPTGMYILNGLNYFDGRFSGADPDGNHLYSMPVTSGASGSPVYNNDGEVIGLVSAVLVEFHHISIGVGRENILEFLLSAD